MTLLTQNPGMFETFCLGYNQEEAASSAKQTNQIFVNYVPRRSSLSALVLYQGGSKVMGVLDSSSQIFERKAVYSAYDFKLFTKRNLN